ncbi:Cell cycle checkpoint control protein RAD9A [Ananas comosus]|uniref:Cell cycle checkpoint control protein RAD9A n=1 Tax=Ananas comosus TaxID=4615 RepID=A0A199VAX2_ANACO|nr:Cell cycle checkpoint control protein RAD9A [Ananas comosus]
MELSLSGNSLRTFTRSVPCLARVGSDLLLLLFPSPSPSKLELHALNSSRSAYQTISFAAEFFDHFSLLSSSSPSSSPLQCGVLLKSVCSILRTPAASLHRLVARLPAPDAPKLQWTLHCLNGVKKTYWISCQVEPDIQQLSLDRQRFPSSLVVRPRDLSRLLANFQSSLQEITIIATEPLVGPSDAGGEIGGKAVELRSYIDPAKDSSDAALHTQLWIDPAEEFLQYNHVGDPVDVTFSVKELKVAFLTFCEGCEVDIHLFFEKAGEPILLAPKFELDDGSHSDFDATLVLSTMLVSQLTDGSTSERPSAPPAHETEHARAANVSPAPQNTSENTKIWSELSGSAARSDRENREKQAEMERNPSTSGRDGMRMHNTVNAPGKLPAQEDAPNIRQPIERDHMDEPQEVNANPNSQHHPSNWVGADDDDDEEEEELYIIKHEN